MVKLTSVTTITSSGLKNWLIQNFTAFFMMIYVLGLMSYLIINPVKDFYSWSYLFHLKIMQIATLLCLFFMIIHTRLGLWMIATDYLKNTRVRIGFLIVTSLVLASSFIWAISIVWGA